MSDFEFEGYTYAFFAEQAAEFERAGFYSKAEALWLKASRFAEVEQNRHWADCRALVCAKAKLA